MIHSDTELRPVNAVVGLGVFATRRLPRGTVTWVRDPSTKPSSPSCSRLSALTGNNGATTPPLPILTIDVCCAGICAAR